MSKRRKRTSTTFSKHDLWLLHIAVTLRVEACEENDYSAEALWLNRWKRLRARLDKARKEAA